MKFFPKPFGPSGDAFIQRIEMLRDRAFDFSKVRKIQIRRIDLADFPYRFVPGFDVQFRRNKRRNGRTTANADAGDVATEDVVVPVINMMMTGVTGCSDGADFEWRNA